MAAICTSSVNPTGCAHRTLSILWDGVTHVLPHLTDAEIAATPLTTEEKQHLTLLMTRYLRSKGVSLATFVNRCVIGEEATNVKVYQFFGPGATITKTNIGTSYVNICVGLNGERQIVDFTGCTEYRLSAHVNVVGSGQLGVRVIRDTDSTVLAENTNLGATGEREFDTDWQALPAAFVGAALVLMRVQGKSTTGADDPVFRSLKVALR